MLKSGVGVIVGSVVSIVGVKVGGTGVGNGVAVDGNVGVIVGTSASLAAVGSKVGNVGNCGSST